jgi:hypothetical protein
MAAQECQRETKATCHRYKAARPKGSPNNNSPQQQQQQQRQQQQQQQPLVEQYSIQTTTWRRKFYKIYSSIFDGENITLPDW